MNKGAKPAAGLLLRLSIHWKFGIMMGGFMVLLSAAIAATFWTANLQKGDAAVINVAGRQRMLSQKMTKEAMALMEGKVKKEEVFATADLFERSLEDLASGNEAGGLPPTEDPEILSQLSKVKEIWRKFRENLVRLADANEERRSVVSTIVETNGPLLEDMNDAVFMMEEEKMDARTINLAGRQRMLSQKMAKEALILEAGGKGDDLRGTMALFDQTLKGLIAGNDALELKPMRNAAILAQLRKVEEKWGLFRSKAERLIELTGPVQSHADYLLTSNLLLLKEMNAAVGQYEAASTAKIRYLKIIQMVLLCVTLLFFGVGWFFVTNPIVRSFTDVTENLSSRSQDIEGVTSEINDGVTAQKGIVETATRNLEDMIINIIQGNISMSVEKQAEIAKAFGEFLKQFVERTSAEIAMGIMSISQQSDEAIKGIGEFVSELDKVETNIRDQERAISGMVEALKSIVAANREIKGKAHGSTEAADKATAKAAAGREKIRTISEQLQAIGTASEGVRNVTDSLAAITESIKILALNMSLKVEDIKDDTGKSYGFEAMSAKVQQLAEEVEELLASSREMLIPTIEGIARVSREAAEANDTIAEVARSIKSADDESKAITERIDRQASDIDRVEIEAENLRALAHKTTEAIAAQGALAKDVNSMLKESVVLIDSVNSQTTQSVDGARKVTQMMEQMRKAVASIEDGTGVLTEKSTEIAEMFSSIRDLAEKNRGGAEKLGQVNTSVREVSRKLTEVVKGA